MSFVYFFTDTNPDTNRGICSVIVYSKHNDTMRLEKRDCGLAIESVCESPTLVTDGMPSYS